jgi:hypothetical protein
MSHLAAFLFVYFIWTLQQAEEEAENEHRQTDAECTLNEHRQRVKEKILRPFAKL